MTTTLDNKILQAKRRKLNICQKHITEQEIIK